MYRLLFSTTSLFSSSVKKLKISSFNMRILRLSYREYVPNENTSATLITILITDDDVSDKLYSLRAYYGIILLNERKIMYEK